MSATLPAPLSRWLLSQLAEGALPTTLAAPLHRRARRDAAWGSWYHLLRQTERGVGVAEQPAALSANQKDLLKALIFADPSVSASASASTSSSTSSAGFTIGSGALAAACAGALVLVAQPAPPVDDDVASAPVFTARGDEQLRLRVRCVVDGAVSGDVESRADSTRLECSAGGLLAIAVTNTSAVARRVAVEVVDVDGIDDRPLGAIDVPAGAVNVLVPTGLRLDGSGLRTLRLVDIDGGAARSADVVVDAR